ncbi:MAG TPA: hypothetical protein VMV69_12335 [Pirellulales bacterium]|nr:hypothetical protein [Pirellulales bacterium]
MADPLVFHASRGTTRLFQILTILGGVTLLAGFVVAPQRAWADLLLVSFDLLGLGLGAAVWLAILHVTGARWSHGLRRPLEAMTAILPLAAAGLAAVVFCRPSLYPCFTSAGSDDVSSPLRTLWLGRFFFLSRTVAYSAIWIAFTGWMVRASRRQDLDGTGAASRKNVRRSAAFLVVFGVTCWLASSDWLMSLEPEWSSSMFGVYSFAGMFLSSLAAVTLLVIWLRRHGPLRPMIDADQLHDMGTLLFALSSFWMYTWFCQYWLIWYVNNPEETAYFARRQQAGWWMITLLDLALNWGLPFLVLLFRSAKRNPVVLGVVCVVILVGRWVDLFLMVFPSQGNAAPALGAIEVGLPLGAAGAFGLVCFRALAAAWPVPAHGGFPGGDDPV